MAPCIVPPKAPDLGAFCLSPYAQLSMSVSVFHDKIVITDESKAELNDLTTYYRQLLRQQSDPSDYNRICQEELSDLVRDWEDLDHEAKGLLIWTLNNLF